MVYLHCPGYFVTVCTYHSLESLSFPTWRKSGFSVKTRVFRIDTYVNFTLEMVSYLDPVYENLTVNCKNFRYRIVTNNSLHDEFHFVPDMD